LGRVSHIYYFAQLFVRYGTRLDEVQAFVTNGWQSCGNNEGDLSGKGKLFRVGWTNFMDTVLPGLTAEDTVLLINSASEAEGDRVSTAVLASGCRVGQLNVHAASQESSVKADGLCAVANIRMSMGGDHAMLPFAVALATKLALNVISTGANVMKGAVYGNTMINLTVSNNKLMQRSAEIVADITGCPALQAHRALLCAIHGVDVLSDELSTLPSSVHIALAAPKRNIVPTAALLATGTCSYAEASAQLNTSASPLRELIRQAVSQSQK
jgi:hypothetical protein